MDSLPPPPTFFLLLFSGWINRHQVVSMCHISLARVVRRPLFGLAGCTRSRGRRQPYLRTRCLARCTRRRSTVSLDNVIVRGRLFLTARSWASRSRRAVVARCAACGCRDRRAPTQARAIHCGVRRCRAQACRARPLADCASSPPRSRPARFSSRPRIEPARRCGGGSPAGAITASIRGGTTVTNTPLLVGVGPRAGAAVGVEGVVVRRDDFTGWHRPIRRSRRRGWDPRVRDR
jgi:hypothetical protein